MKASISTTEAALMSITAALLSATSTFCIISYLKRLQDAEIREKSLAEYEVEKREAEGKRKGAQCPVGTLIQDVRIDEIYHFEKFSAPFGWFSDGFEKFSARVVRKCGPISTDPLGSGVWD